MSELKPVVMVPRYWPAVGGAELHSRRLVQELQRHCQPTALRFCSDEPHPTDTAFAYSQPAVQQDNGVAVMQVAAAGVARQLLQPLGRFCGTNRWARGAFSALSAAPLSHQLTQFARDHDLIHGIYNGFTPAFDAARRAALPFVFTPLAHTTRPAGTAWSSNGFRRLYREADGIVAMTEYEREWLIRRGASDDRVIVAPMAPMLGHSMPEPSHFREAHGIGDHPMVLFLGRAAPYKGYQQVMDSMPAVWRHHPDTRFVFTGPGQFMDGQPDDPRIILTGPVSEDDKKSALAACTLLCVPSTEESLGVVYLEAWTFAKPVIAANIPVLQSVVTHGHDGLLCEQDPTEIAIEISRLLDDPEMGAEMGRHGALKVEREYNWAESAERILQLYRSVMD
jgi:glycosyltransferase involved in cell wall biosynthesis